MVVVVWVGISEINGNKTQRSSSCRDAFRRVHFQICPEEVKSSACQHFMLHGGKHWCRWLGETSVVRLGEKSLLYSCLPSKKKSWDRAECPCKNDCATQCHAQEHQRMDCVPKAIGIFASGVHSNWWGLGCPAHCFGSGLPALCAAFALGLLIGLIFGALFCAWAFELLPRSRGGSGPPISQSQGLLG